MDSVVRPAADRILEGGPRRPYPHYSLFFRVILLSLEPLLLLLMLLSPAEVMLQDGAKRSVYHRVWGKLHLPTHVRASPSVSQREHRRGQRTPPRATSAWLCATPALSVDAKRRQGQGCSTLAADRCLGYDMVAADGCCRSLPMAVADRPAASGGTSSCGHRRPSLARRRGW